ncbi:hypothetical protein [Thalassococcus sp. S3]|uniref:FitA-like ribbon-helix-helix domain-containing protein n=1 Tax=Thalassococcus sp. S3 TaxID=2017482 RepID=UPI0010246CE1|nr:hypothetical protein [Thalassococcus sp. S3]QBF34236.1 hypothetical protein CFI11_23920 [Thalassococcus sp. S3]
MATLTIRNVDTDLHDFLRQSAARNGRSMEAEVRAVLAERMQAEDRSAADVVQSIRARFAGLETDLTLPNRDRLPDPIAPDA